MSYRSGDYLAICDICGMRGYSSEMRMTWDKLFVYASTCYDPKHEQYTPPKPLGEAQKVPIHRPEQDDVFITENVTAEDL